MQVEPFHAIMANVPWHAVPRTPPARRKERLYFVWRQLVVLLVCRLPSLSQYPSTWHREVGPNWQ